MNSWTFSKYSLNKSDNGRHRWNILDVSFNFIRAKLTYNLLFANFVARLYGAYSWLKENGNDGGSSNEVVFFVITTLCAFRWQYVLLILLWIIHFERVLVPFGERESARKAVTDVLLCLPVSVLVHRRRLLFWENVHLPIKPSLKTTPVCCRDGRCVWLVPND